MTDEVQLVLLPGLDGTARLFRHFVETAPAWAAPHPIALPRRRYGSHAELARALLPELPEGDGLVLLGESFSGPLALELAERVGSRCGAVVLCASFVASPVPALARLVPWRLALAAPPPRWAVRRYLTDGAPRELADEVAQAMAEAGPSVLADRVRMLSRLDARALLRRVPQPVAYLRPTRDRLVGEKAVDEIAALRPDLRVAEVDGPHLLLQARPRESWRALETLLQRAEARVPA